MVVLALLRRKDMYGYELVQGIADSSSGLLTTQEGSLYPVLYQLEDAGLISQQRIKVGKRMHRVYYHLEPAGLQRLEALTREYQQITQAVLNIITEGGQLDETRE